MTTKSGSISVETVKTGNPRLPVTDS